MKIKSLPILLVLTLLPLMLAGCDLISNPLGTNGDLDPILASGVIEADQVNIAPELSGRIKTIHVEEGSSVSAGDIIISLEDDQLLIQKALAVAQYEAALAMQESAKAALKAAQSFQLGAEANLSAAKIQYEQVLAQVQALEGEYRVTDWIEITPNQIDLPAWYYQQSEKITAAEHVVDLAWSDYQDQLNNYQEVAADIGGEDFFEAEQRLAAAQAAFEIAEALRDRQVGYWSGQEILDQVDSLFDSAETELETAQEAYDLILTAPQYEDILEARARVSVSREHYDLARVYLAEQFSGVYAFDVQVAEALVAQAEAGLLQAEAQITQAEFGLSSADATIKQAEATLDLINLQLEKTHISSPITGVILSQAVEAGEMIGAGFTALTVGDLNNLTVTVYLPEDRYGQVSIADLAELSIDSYPEKTFEAEVIYISDQAEYTPRNVQTQEERQNTVYAVKLSIKNTSGILKPGMPADVVFQP